jgi:hypothetical protein
MEREVITELTWEIGDVGSMGHFLGRRFDINQGVNPFWSCSTSTNPSTGQPEPSCKVAYESHPYPGRVSATGSAQSLTYQTQDVNSNYHALQTSLRRRSRKGLTLLVSYTFSKMIDSASNTNNSTSGTQKYPQNSWDPAAERALSDLNRKHQFTASINYELPFGRGRWLLADAHGLGDAFVSGWQANVKGSVLSGRPFTPQYNSADFTSERPNLVGDPYQAGPVAGNPDCIAPSTLDSLGAPAFNPCAFIAPSAQAEAAYALNPSNPNPKVPVYGNAGRNSLTGPRFFTIDLGMSKEFSMDKIHDRAKLQFRVEAFNLLNHPNFQVPNYYLDQPNAGQYRTMAADQRVFQFVLKALF